MHGFMQSSIFVMVSFVYFLVSAAHAPKKDSPKPSLKKHQDKVAPAPAKLPAPVQRPLVARRPVYPRMGYQPYQHPYNTAQSPMAPMSAAGGACLQQC